MENEHSLDNESTTIKDSMRRGGPQYRDDVLRMGAERADDALVSRLNMRLAQMETQILRERRTPWSLIWAGLAVMGVVLSGQYKTIVEPLQAANLQAQTRVERIETVVNGLSVASATAVVQGAQLAKDLDRLTTLLDQKLPRHAMRE